MTGRVAAAGLGALAGASAWISLGTLALTEAGSRTRVGALPPIWALVVLAVLGAAAVIGSRMAVARAWPLAVSGLVWLPWLPGRVPAAFLIWNGQLEALVWTAVAVGLVAPVLRVPAMCLRWFADGRRAPVLAAAIAFASYVVGACAVAEHVPAGDEPHYLIITQSLLRDGDLRIENNHSRGDYASYYPGSLPRPDFMRRGTDGEIYSVHLPGLSVMVLPAFALFGYFGVVAFVSLVMAVGGAFAWHAAWLLTADACAAWLAWAGVAFSAPIFFHAFTVYPDGVGAALTMLAVWVLIRLDRREDTVGSVWLALAGASLGVLPWLHTRFAVVSAGLGLVFALRLIVRADRFRALAAFLAPPLVAAASWFGYFWIIYGAPDPSLPYNGLGQNRLATLEPGLPGILFDQQFGLLANAPVFAVAIAGVWPLARRRLRLTIEMGIVSAAYLLAVASFVMWWAGYSAPARFLVVLLWPAVVPIAWTWKTAASPAARTIVVGAVGLSVLLTLARAGVDGGRLLYNGRDGYDLLLDWASPTVNLPLAFPSLHRDVVPMALRDIGVWLACGAVTWASLAWLLRRETMTTAKSWTVSALAAAACLMVSSTLIWQRHGDAVLKPTTSELALLLHWSPSLRPLIVEMSPMAVLSADRMTADLELSTPSREAQRPGRHPLLTLPQVPPGRYSVSVDGPGPPRGRLHVSIGRADHPLETWSLATVPSPILDLPVTVHSVTIEGDEQAQTTVRHVALHPLAIEPSPGRLTSGYARQAAAYGPVRVFFLDEDAFMEESGFWTRGGADTAVVIDRAAAGVVRMRVRNGAAPNEISISSGEWRADLALAPAEVREIAIPTAGQVPEPRLVTLETAAGFRPAEVEPGSDDRRMLGAWIEFR